MTLKELAPIIKSACRSQEEYGWSYRAFCEDAEKDKDERDRLCHRNGALRMKALAEGERKAYYKGLRIPIDTLEHAFDKGCAEREAGINIWSKEVRTS